MTASTLTAFSVWSHASRILYSVSEKDYTHMTLRSRKGFLASIVSIDRIGPGKQALPLQRRSL